MNWRLQVLNFSFSAICYGSAIATRCELPAPRCQLEAPTGVVAPGARSALFLPRNPVVKELLHPTVGSVPHDTFVRPRGLRQRLRSKSRSMDTPSSKREIVTGNAD